MSNYNIEIRLDRVICRDTESIHSSDKFCLAGAIATDIDSGGITLPRIRINNGEVRELNLTVFSGESNVDKVALALQAWDIDENDSWKDNEVTIKAIVSSIASAVKTIPKYGTVSGLVIDGLNELVPKIVNEFNKADKDDQLLDYKAWLDVPATGAHLPTTHSFNVDFKRDSFLGYTSFNYSLQFTVFTTLLTGFVPGPPPTPESQDKIALRRFRDRADRAKQLGFVGGFPNFHEAKRGRNFVEGTIFLTANGVEFRNVTLRDLHNPNLNIFAERMKAVQDYAVLSGFVGGFPTCYQESAKPWAMPPHPTPDTTTLCGSILIPHSAAVWRDIPLIELGNPSLEDIGARFRATNDYAVRNGFLSGFPNFYHADHGLGTVCGSILLKPEAGEWRDVVVSTDAG